MKIVAIIQARMGSSRLPGKVLMELIGEPLLAHVVKRTGRAKTISNIVVATTTNQIDDIIVQFCQKNGWLCFRGNERDVLDRYYQAAVEYQADVIVRITSDCPLIEPEIIDGVVGEYLKNPLLDYVSNTLAPRTFPHGLDVEVVSFEALKCAWEEDNNYEWREHVTPYIYRHPEKFTIRTVANDKDLSYMRWTVDTPEDLDFVRHIYEHFCHDHFSWKEVLALLEKNPEWLEINRHIKQRQVP